MTRQITINHRGIQFGQATQDKASRHRKQGSKQDGELKPNRDKCRTGKKGFTPDIERPTHNGRVPSEPNTKTTTRQSRDKSHVRKRRSGNSENVVNFMKRKRRNSFQ